MAATRLIALHINKGHTVADCLKARTDYASNPEKTEKGELVTGYECDPMTCDEEFLLSKREYQQKTGRTFIGALKKETNDIIAYQIRQSFKPGEITAEEANRVGYETAMRFTKGKHAFIVTTHTDKAHIHNHIIFNSTTLDCTKKFRDFYFSGIALQRLSDIICIEHGLSIIDAKTYPKRGKNPKFKKRDSYRDFICADIDDILKKKPKDFEEFLKMIQDAGYECKRGKHVAFRSKSQKRFVRMRSLGENYSEEAIMAVLSGNREHQTKFNDKHPRPQRPLKLLVDVQAKLNEKGPGYARWATSYNLKEMAKTMIFIRENKIDTLEELQDLARGKASDYDELDAKLKAIESRLSDVAILKKHIINYRKTKDTYVAYRKAGYSKKFLEEHRQEITLHKAAKEYFDQLPGDKLPTIKALNEEYASLLAEKKKISSNYYPARSEMKEYVTAERNVRTFLEIGEEAERKQKEVQRQSAHPEH